ncbi:MAG: hypothetical protein C5B49_13085 [Bdellovibrio sp.]|nr:MAG: hypothetical protein C5B49_13085 [Bdellovibrio sp.]
MSRASMSLIWCLGIFLWPSPVGGDHAEFLILWRSGGGQIVSWIKFDKCLHFDLGGDFAIWSRISNLCHRQLNYLFISHRDRENLRLNKKLQTLPHCFVLNSSSWIPDPVDPSFVCERPAEVELWTPKRMAEGSIARGTAEVPKAPTWLSAAHAGHAESPARREDQKSAVYLLAEARVLIAGDSTKEQEWDWLPWAAARQPRILVLGSHGHHRSSESILSLPSLRWTLASSASREKKTPLLDFLRGQHLPPRSRLQKETRNRLKRRKLPVIETRDWGNVILQTR